MRYGLNRVALIFSIEMPLIDQNKRFDASALLS